MLKNRLQVIPAVYIGLLRNGGQEILLGKRINTGYSDGLYGLPSGHMEENESLCEGIIREASEEVGICVEKKDLQLVHTQWRDTIPGNPGRRIDFFFSCTRWEGEIRNVEPEKCEEWQWFPLNNLPSNIIQPVKLAIQNGFIQGINLSEIHQSERQQMEK